MFAFITFYLHSGDQKCIITNSLILTNSLFDMHVVIFRKCLQPPISDVFNQRPCNTRACNFQRFFQFSFISLWMSIVSHFVKKIDTLLLKQKLEQNLLVYDKFSLRKHHISIVPQLNKRSHSPGNVSKKLPKVKFTLVIVYTKG